MLVSRIVPARKASADVDGSLAVVQGLWSPLLPRHRANCRQGLVDAYIHTAGRIGALVEVNCETDFVARTDDFKNLAHCLAMQVAALAPQYVSEEDIPEGAEVAPEEVCLLSQAYIKDPSKTIKDLITETIATTGENIQVKRFTRFELGSQD